MEEKTDLRIRKPYKALCDAFVTILEKKRFDDLTVNELCDCSRSKFLSKIFKIIVKNFREIFPVFPTEKGA